MLIERESKTYSPRGDILYGPDSLRTKEELAADIYYYDLNRVAAREGLSTFNTEDETAKRLDRIKKRLNTKEMRKGLPVRVRESDNRTVHAAGAFYSECIKPWLATGADAYKPTDDDITHFCERAANGIGVNIVQYYALSKTQSPGRTGSPNTTIDFAELEMLKHQATMAKVADRNGLKINFTIVDETDILPEDEFLGFNSQEIRTNRLVAGRYLIENGASDRIRIRSLRDSIAVPLGEDFETLYRNQLAESQLNTKTALKTSDQRNSPLIKRITTFLECMPKNGLNVIGIDPSTIENVRADVLNGKLENIPSQALEYLISLTSHVDAMMALRGRAKLAVQQNSLTDEYPEYQDESRVYGGVTRSTHRWSFLPHPTKFMGRTVNPMHGLAGYDTNGNYLGNIPFNMMLHMQNENNGQLVYLDNKPVLGKVRK